MKSKHISLPLLGVLLLLYGGLSGLNYIQVTPYISSGGFAEIFNQSFHFGAMSLFLGLIWLSLNSSNGIAVPSLKTRFWWLGFLSVILVSVGLAVYVNPHARFGGNRFPHITPGARLEKIDLFKSRDEIPDVVIFGSSRAFTISPQFIEEKTGHSAFNMAVESGGVNDYLSQLKFLIKAKSTPRILLIEVHQNSIGDVPPKLNAQPVTMLPYMTADVVAWVVEDTLKHVLSLQSVSDSIFLLLKSDSIEKFWNFELTGDGQGVRPTPTHENYVLSIKQAIKTGANNSYCSQIVPRGREVMEVLLSLAEENGIGVVLYVSPINSAFYNYVYDANPKAFSHCHKLLYDYLVSLSKTHPNVFIKDLSSYQTINNLAEDGFYDAVHLKPDAAKLVIDTLLPEIESAMAWSLQQVKK